MQDISFAPDGGNQVPDTHAFKLFSELADKDINDLDIRLIPPAIEVVEEGFLGLGDTLAQNQQLQHGKFLARQMQDLILDGHGLAVQIKAEITHLNDGVSKTVRTAQDCLNTRHKLGHVRRLAHEVIRTQRKGAELGFGCINT